MSEDTVLNTVASLYSLSDLHIGSFDFTWLLGNLSESTLTATIFNSFKILGGVLAVALFIMFVINFIRTDRYLRARTNLLKTIVPPQAAQTSPLGSRWEEVQRHLDSTREAEWKFAVIEADNLVDDILKSSGYPGETMGERLKNIDKTQIVNIDNIWEAHKIRNRLAHDSSYFLRYGEAKRAIQLYEKALKELNAL